MTSSIKITVGGFSREVEWNGLDYRVQRALTIFYTARRLGSENDPPGAKLDAIIKELAKIIIEESIGHYEKEQLEEVIRRGRGDLDFTSKVVLPEPPIGP